MLNVTSLKVRLFLRGFLLLFIYDLLIAHDLKIGKEFLEKKTCYFKVPLDDMLHNI